MRTVIAATSDHHINATIAVCKPFVTLEEGNPYHNSVVQNWLWSCQQDFNERIRRAIVGATFYDIYVGDVAELDAKDRTNELITRNTAIAREIATETTAERRGMADRVFVVRGTGAHVGRSAEHEEALAYDWGAEKCPDTGRHSWKALRLEVDGVVMEFEHHPARRTARAQADYLTLKRAKHGHRVPRLAVYGHYHTFDDSDGHVPICRTMFLPAWCVATEHVFRIGRGTDIADIGGLIITIEDGRLDVEPVIYHPALSAAWREPHD